MPAETRCGRAAQSLCTLIMCCGCFSGIFGTPAPPVVSQPVVIVATSQPPIRKDFATDVEYHQALAQWRLAQQAVLNTDAGISIPEPPQSDVRGGASNYRVLPVEKCKFWERTEVEK